MFLCGDFLGDDWVLLNELSLFHLGVALFFRHLFALICVQVGSPLNRLYFLHGGAKLLLEEVLLPVVFPNLTDAQLSHQELKLFHWCHNPYLCNVCDDLAPGKQHYLSASEKPQGFLPSS